jgi:hypothetical protein
MTNCLNRNYIIPFILSLLFFCKGSTAQDWNFKLRSKVELRSWILSSRAEKNSSHVNGASIKLYKGSAVVSQTHSDESGNFELSIPSNGDYTILIEYPGCDPKKFEVRTRDVPPNKNDIHFKPTVDIGGTMSSKPAKDGKYLGIDQTHIRIVYPGAKSKPAGEKENKNFHFRQNIYDAEYLAIQKFCIANRLGDMALEKNNYELARKFYSMASGMMSAEQYPKEKLKIADDALKLAQAAAKKSQKAKPATPKQVVVVDPKKSSDFKNSSSGKGRKIRKAL